jgi:hypothetical protein
MPVDIPVALVSRLNWSPLVARKIRGDGKQKGGRFSPFAGWQKATPGDDQELGPAADRAK